MDHSLGAPSVVCIAKTESFHLPPPLPSVCQGKTAQCCLCATHRRKSWLDTWYGVSNNKRECLLMPQSHNPTDATVCAGCGEAAAGWPGAQNTSWRHRDAKSRSCVHTKTARWHVVVMIMMTLLELNIKQNLKPNEASSWTVLWCSSPPAALSLQQLYLMSRMTMMAMMTRTIKATMRRICMSRVKEQPMRN